MGGSKALQSVAQAPPPPDPSIAENQAQQDLLKKQRAASTSTTGALGLTGKASTSARTLLGN